jgi:hypothetical protein
VPATSCPLRRRCFAFIREIPPPCRATAKITLPLKSNWMSKTRKYRF